MPQSSTIKSTLISDAGSRSKHSGTAGGAARDGVLAQFRAVEKPIERYLFLRDLLSTSAKQYYSLLLQHTEEILPFIYTPTVGEACQRYHELPLRPHGLYLSLADRGNILAKLRAGPVQDIEVIVVTDGERILGLGDLGANGMGIAEGKITLYTAAAGVDPRQCLPVCLDVGTNNDALLKDPAYKGLRQRRPPMAEYDAFVAEFMAALQQWRPHVLLQFEDFGNHNAFRLLDRYASNHCAFNDDIQGTACITLAGLLSAVRATGRPLSQHTILFYGAGEAGTGIGQLIAQYLHLRHGLPLEEGRRRCIFMDSQGLVTSRRGPVEKLQHHKRPFAHDLPYVRDLVGAVEVLRPSVLVGVSTQAGAFDDAVLGAMAAINARPIVFPLSNPTSKSECTFEQALAATRGRVLFASGSPFDPAPDPVTHELRYPAQANNAYIFPAVGFAAVLARSRAITDEMFVVAAEELAAMTDRGQLEEGRLFPSFSNIRAVSKLLAARVAEHMVSAGLGTTPSTGFTGDWEEYVARRMWSTDKLSSL